MYTRILLQQIIKKLFQRKILILYGARQVGKTTLCKEILQTIDKKKLYLSCDDPLVQLALIGKSAEQIYQFFQQAELVILDEAQTVPDIGNILKRVFDKYPDMQIIATGSSSFDLAQRISEPLTGRSLEYMIYPLSIEEIALQKDELSIQSNLDTYLTYGLYPEIIDIPSEEARTLITNISTKYLYKDVLQFQGIKKPTIVIKILQALAYQIGSEVSLPELALLVGSNKNTVEKYIDILEQAFVIYRLPAFSTNRRNEIRKSQKIYFYDIGMRNALIQDFRDMTLRQDRGAIWENFILTELKKKYNNHRQFAEFYFWRTYEQQEIDLILRDDLGLHAREIKIQSKKSPKIPAAFLREYPEVDFQVIERGNWRGRF